MALDIPDMGNIGASVMSGASQAYIYILIFIILAVCGVVIFLIVMITSYKHKFRIRDVTDNRKIIFDDRAREVKDKTGNVLYWQLFKGKRKVSAPPSKAIEIDSKGRKVVEVHRNEEGEFTWIYDNAQILPIPKEISEIKDYTERKEALNEWQKENKIVASFETYGYEERSFNIDQHEKALAKKGQSWKDLLLSLAPFGALIVFAAILVFGFGTLTKPSLEMGQQLSGTIEKVAEVERIELEKLQTVREIELGIQRIQQEMGITQQNQPPPN